MIVKGDGEIFITEEIEEENKLSAVEGQWGRTQRQNEFK